MKKLTAWLVAAAMLLCCLPTVSAEGETVTGFAGFKEDPVYFEYTLSTGVLRFYGEGTTFRTEEYNAFFDEYQKQIVKVVFEEGITYIGSLMLQYASAVKDISLPSTLIAIDAAAFAYTAIETAELPEGLLAIGSGAFKVAPLRQITFPESLTHIYPHAFQYTKLTSVVIPKNVERIGAMAFGDMPTLKSVIISTPSAVDRPEDEMVQNYAAFGYKLSSIVFEDADFPLRIIGTDDSKGIFAAWSYDNTLCYYAPSGGWVEEYCKQLDRPFVPLESLTAGDADGDGALTTKDMRQTLSVISAQETLDSRGTYCADMDHDYQITTSDVRRMAIDIIGAA